LAEQFKHTYFSAREFVSSWEKEIYELNNLDYFIYLLINELAQDLEKSFFAKLNEDNLLFLQSEEIGTLTFNLGDSLQLFLEDNCFGVCPLNCPLKINERIGAKEKNMRRLEIPEKEPVSLTYSTKEEFFYFDIFNYAVLDSIVDFYNYDMGLILSETDERFHALSEFIMDVIIKVIKNNDAKFLRAPKENAAFRFEEMIKNDDSSWEEHILSDDEDAEDEESEIWKISTSGVKYLIEKFGENYTANFESSPALKHIENFKEYLTDFLEISKIEDLTSEDLGEFFCVILLNDLSYDDPAELKNIEALFVRFFSFLEFNHDIHLKPLFNKFTNLHFDDFIRAFHLTRQYREENSYIDFLISGSKKEEMLAEGFYEVLETKNGIFKLEDIHLKSQFKPVYLPNISMHKVKAGDILHAQLEIEGLGWRLVHLEIAYPPLAKLYLY